MDQNTANALFDKGGFLVVLDAPQGLEFGIDMNTWVTGPLFKGLKLIPPGIHYIHYSPTDNSQNNAGMRCGFFHNFTSGQVVVRRWCSETEQLMPVDAESSTRIHADIRSIDRNLGAYPIADHLQWLKQSSHITPRTLHRTLPASLGFTSATGSVYEDEELAAAQKTLSSQRGVAPVQPSVDGDDRFGFPHIDVRRSIPPNVQGGMVRVFSEDKSWLLRKCTGEFWGDSAALLGDFQIAFLAIFVGQNFSGFEYWKRMLGLVLGSSGVLGDMGEVEGLVRPFVEVLVGQLEVCPEEFVASVLEADNFLARVVCKFALDVYEMDDGECRRVLSAVVEGLGRVFAERFGWTLPSGRALQELADAEEGEYAPQVV